MQQSTKVNLVMIPLVMVVTFIFAMLLSPFMYSPNYSAPLLSCDIDTTNIHTMRYVQWYRAHGDIDTVRRMFYYPALKIYLLKEGFTECEATIYAELPSVESNWRNDLTSSAGAIGIWQIMPSLGNSFKKTSTDLKDPAVATFVAVEYLKNLKKMFRNDIAKVLFAYNSGASNVQKTLREYKTDNAWLCTFKSRETQEFAPKLLAAVYYMNYDTYRK